MHKVSFFKSIHVKIVLIYVLLIIIALQIIGIYFSSKLEESLKLNFKDSITQRIELVQYSIREELLKERDETSPTLEQSLGVILLEFPNEDINEILIINNRSKVLAALENQSIGGSRFDTDTVTRAISAEDYSANIRLESGNRVWVLAAPIMDNVGPNSEVIGAIYIKADIESVFEQMKDINQIFAIGTAMSLAITIVLGILFAKTITKPILDMRRQAQAMSRGNYARKVRVYGDDEIGQLALAFNHLTNRLQEAQSTTEAERRKLASVLSNMTDGVIATDRKGKVILINDPALTFLDVTRETTLSRPIASVLGLDQEYSFEDLIHMKESINLAYSESEFFCHSKGNRIC